MAVPLYLAQQLQQQAAPLARRLGSEFAHEFGLTVDENRVGWKLLGLIALELWENVLKGPITGLWTIEQQIVGVLDQLYAWLGGVGSALDGAAKVLGTDVAYLEGAVNWATGGWL